MNQWLVATLWVALALAAGLISVRTAISVSLLEIAMGVVGGNYLGLRTTQCQMAVDVPSCVPCGRSRLPAASLSTSRTRHSFVRQQWVC